MSEEQIDWQQKYHNLKSWASKVMITGNMLNSIGNKKNKELNMLLGTYFHWCGNCSESYEEELKNYLNNNLTADKWEKVKKRNGW